MILEFLCIPHPLPRSILKSLHFVSSPSHYGRRSLQEDTNLQLFSYDDLRIFTNDFSDENRIDDFQFGKLFRGRIQDREVVVKIWQPGGIYRGGHDNNTLRLRDEIILLQLPELICNPNLVELIGYCREGEHIGVVYDLKALDTVFNLIRKGSLTWLHIVKIGIGFASLLKFLHTDNPPLQSYIVCNISPSHIILDKDFFPMLIDYGELSGGILPDSRPVKGMGPRGCFGYMRDAYAYTQKNDVYAYGSVLLSLICKRVFTEEDRLSYRPYVAEWAESRFKASLFSSLVDQSFVKEEGYFHRDAIEVTKLAIQCVAYYSEDRPTMEQEGVAIEEVSEAVVGALRVELASTAVYAPLVPAELGGPGQRRFCVPTLKACELQFTFSGVSWFPANATMITSTITVFSGQ
ncbi:hypothetical protein Tsubulata_036772 [Turnera subulata]|uniref:Protein kinase domain-containing protein n=1 Tax=Turnera subulata TaxID=218843 RepID=A0A9Q0FQT9_9ROSI|nr:hypothetical protein Tsubulata_036772 [Turnera subulata]